MTDSAALASELAELNRRSAFDNPAGEAAVDRARDVFSATCFSNLPAILRALCVQAAVDERNNMICRAGCMFTGNYLSQRADELLAELNLGGKDGNG